MPALAAPVAPYAVKARNRAASTGLSTEEMIEQLTSDRVSAVYEVHRDWCKQCVPHERLMRRPRKSRKPMMRRFPAGMRNTQIA